MKKFLSLIVLFSLFLIQIHGVNHSESDDNNKDHHCTICKTASHQPSLVPTTIDVDLTPELAPNQLFHITENNFVLKSLLSKSISPRAPPII